MREKISISQFTHCNTNKMLKPLDERPWNTGKYPLLECLSQEACRMRVDRWGKPPVCTAAWGNLDNLIKGAN